MCSLFYTKALFLIVLYTTCTLSRFALNEGFCYIFVESPICRKFDYDIHIQARLVMHFNCNLISIFNPSSNAHNIRWYKQLQSKQISEKSQNNMLSSLPFFLCNDSLRDSEIYKTLDIRNKQMSRSWAASHHSPSLLKIISGITNTKITSLTYFFF